MTEYIRRAGAVSTLALAFVLAGCGDKKQDNTLAQDTSLSRDLSRVGADSTVQPQLQDVPATTPPAVATPEPAPAKTRPATRPTPTRPRPTTPPVATRPKRDSNVTASGNTVEKGTSGGERSAALPAGTILPLDAADKVCTNTNHVGDRFVATLQSAVSSGGVDIPAGAAVTIELTQLKRSENANDQIQMGFRVVNIAFDGRTYPLDADVQNAEITRIRASSGANDAKKVAAGAAAGAIIGQILGHKAKSTIIGAAAGAAAGGAAAAATANYEGCVNAGANITVKTNAPLNVAVKS
ncbi:MAG: hypothetical protein ABIT38_07040 [Gemmatimonadaceae bacterium]